MRDRLRHNLRKQFNPLFIVPQKENLIQWFNGDTEEGIATFDGNGYVVYPQIYNIPDQTPWSWIALIDMDSSRTLQHFTGNDQNANNRITSDSSADKIELRFSTGSPIDFASYSLQGKGFSVVRFDCDANRNVALTFDGVVVDTKSTTDSAMSFNNFGFGSNAGGATKFVGSYVYTLLSVGGVLQLAHRPTLTGFYDSVSDTTTAASGTGTNINLKYFVDKSRNLNYGILDLGTEEINQSPSENAILIGRGFVGEKTRAELGSEPPHDGVISFTSPG